MGCHHGRMTEVKCSRCQSLSNRHDSTAKSWDCACGSTYVLRHCSACGIVSQVGSLQRNGEPWECMWCQGSQLWIHYASGPCGGDTGRPRRRHGAARPDILPGGRGG